MTATTSTQPDATTAVAGMIRFLETGEVAEGLFAPDMFTDLTLPQWRLQTDNVPDILEIRFRDHSGPGEVTVHRVEPTSRGFTLEIEERWEAGGQRWYCREMIRADVVGSTIVELAIYCTGDWDEATQQRHTAEVALLRR